MAYYKINSIFILFMYEFIIKIKSKLLYEIFNFIIFNSTKGGIDIICWILKNYAKYFGFGHWHLTYNM